MKLYNLPDGRTTKSFSVMLKEWEKLFAPLRGLGLDTFGFDPGVLLITKEGVTFSLPTSVAKIIAETALKAGVKPVRVKRSKHARLV